MTGDAIDAVRAWLKKTGYPFQMRTATQLEDALCREDTSSFMRSGNIYYNYETEESREVDVLLDFATDLKVPESCLLSVAFSIECKNADQPWVLFSSQPYPIGRGKSLYHAVASHSVRGDTGIDQGKELEIHKLMRVPEPVNWHLCATGYALSQINKEKNKPDPAYDALRQAASSARAVISQETVETGLPGLYYAIPVVVTTAPLFIAHHPSGSTEVVVEPVNDLSVSYRSSSDDLIRVRVFNESAIKDRLIVEMRDVRDAVWRVSR